MWLFHPDRDGRNWKTRLALQVAAELVEEFPNGVFFVSLAPVSDAELVVSMLAQTLGLREQIGEPVLETVSAYLRDKQLLLLLDNFEQVVAAAPAIASLRAGAPKLTVLVTSRTPLHLSGEHVYEVPPLTLPDPLRLPALASLSQYEAVALFVERAQAAKSGFTVTNENAPAIAQVCVAVDGLPLAVELAAARVRVLSPQALLGRADQRLKLLTGGRRISTSASRQYARRSNGAATPSPKRRRDSLPASPSSSMAAASTLPRRCAVKGPGSTLKSSTDWHR